jgi:hypothetical protein
MSLYEVLLGLVQVKHLEGLTLQQNVAGDDTGDVLIHVKRK